MRTVGVEEELLLVHAATGVPTAVATAVLRREDRQNVAAGAVATSDPGGTIGAELQQQQIEIDTTPCEDLGDVAEQVRSWRRRADDLARTAGARTAALATSPLPYRTETTLKPRYQAMIEHFGLTTTEQLTCGCHVHVGVDSPEEGVAVLDRVRSWLPVLLALSANSPYWQGSDSGYASFRSQAWNRFPSAGPTETFGDVATYRRLVATMVESGVLLDTGMVYFDARLSEHYPTVEVRIADVCLHADDTVLIAGLVRALVETAVRDWTGGRPAPVVPAELIRLAGWRAGRSGLAEDLLDPSTAQPRPARDVVEALLDHVDVALVEAGDADRVRTGVERVFARGTGAVVQRATFARTDRLNDVVLDAADLTLA